MAGLKQSQLNAVPSAFWTFDSDRTGLGGNAIVDEIGNQNPLTINGDNYMLEQLSLNPIEVVDQHSVTVGWQQKVGGGWPQSHFECPHSSSFDFPILGSFSVEFLYYKEYADQIREIGEPGWRSEITTPLISKGAVLNVRLIDAYWGSDFLTCDVVGRRITVYANTTNPFELFNQNNHVIISYKVTQIDVNEYQSRIVLYINGRLAGEDIKTHFDNYPITVTSDSWFIAGNGGFDPVRDYATETLKLDQIAIYNYGIEDTQVSYHYTRTKHYDQLIKTDTPLRYWRLNDLYQTSNDTMYAEVGGINGVYYGNVGHHVAGPEKLVQSHAMKFNLTGNATVTHEISSRYQPMMNISNPYSVEFWFRSGEHKRGVLFSCVEDLSDWKGVIILLNSKAGTHSPGNIEIHEGRDVTMSSRDVNPITSERENWNDNKWHHIVVTRNSTELKLWLDGELNREETYAVGIANGKPSTIHLMNAAPGDLQVIGEMCELVQYVHALEPMQIQSRWLFTTRYRIEGFTLLQGVPIEATVRFYDHINGELKAEVISNNTTGEYKYYPSSNRYLDVLSFIPDNNTTRYRVHGPVKPTEYDDNHLI